MSWEQTRSECVLEGRPRARPARQATAAPTLCLAGGQANAECVPAGPRGAGRVRPVVKLVPSACFPKSVGHFASECMLI